MNLVDLEKLFIQRKYLLKNFFEKIKRGNTMNTHPIFSIDFNHTIEDILVG